MLKFYDTLSKSVENLEKKDHINLYTCGPTVYNYAHIGNLRAFIMADLLFRSLKAQDYNPKWVMNITDIDDKTIKGTLAEYGKDATVKDLYAFTEKYLQIFKDDLKEVNVSVDEIEMIRVTEKMPEIQEFIMGLMEKGYAYKAEDGVYFNIEKYQKDFGDYGALVGQKFIEGKKVGARVAVDEYEKDNLSDFALWKSHNPETDGQIFWDHPSLGKGRPGWHIECSVINRVAFKGEPTDIHTGGVDLTFPHHTNEIAQSQALLGKGNFVKHWFHSEHLLVDGKKMSKSAGNFYTLEDLRGKVPLSGLALRYSFTQSSFRAQQNFTLENFVSSYRTLEKLYNVIKTHKVIGEAQKLQQDIFEKFSGQIAAAIADDLNIPTTVALIWKVLGQSEANVHTQDKVCFEADKFLGLNLENPPSVLENIEMPVAVEQLLRQRDEARAKKDFAASDRLRLEIESLGYEVLDTAEGQKLKKKL